MPPKNKNSYFVCEQTPKQQLTAECNSESDNRGGPP